MSGLLVGACATARPPVAVQPVPPPSGVDIAVLPVSRDSVLSPSIAHTGPISLGDAIALAMEHNPELQANAWARRAQDGRLRQAGAWPNPTIGLEVEDVGATGALDRDDLGIVQPQRTVQLSQLIELGGERAARRGIARMDRDVAAWDEELARIDVLVGTTRAFVELLAAQEEARLAAEIAAMAATLAEKVDDRITAGDVSPIERTRATLARTSAENAHRIALQNVAARRDRLSGFWGSGEATFERAEGDLLSVSPPPPLDSLTARLAASPALARWTTIAAQRWQAVRLEQARRIPDVTLMGGIRRFSDLDGNTFIFGASLALPLFDRNGGAIEEAEARVAESLERQRAAATAVTRGLREGHRTLDNAYRVILMSRDTLVPGAEEALEAVGEGYRLGKFSYLDVLDVQRTLNEARAGYLRALADYHISVAELERLLGAPLHQSPTLDPSTSQE